MVERSVEELVAGALAAPFDGVEHWQCVHALRKRGGQDVFDAAAALCVRSEPDHRVAGVSILAQIGPWGDPEDPEMPELLWYIDEDPRRFEPFARIQVLGQSPHESKAADLLVGMLAHERESAVLESLFIGLGQLDEPRAIDPAIERLAHPDEKMRCAAVFALLGHDEERAVNALIEFSTDKDADVRCWATLGLGPQGEHDTPAVRIALIARLEDADPSTQTQAMVGLAHYGDDRVTAPLLAKREAFAGRALDEALWLLAANTADPALRDEVELSLEEFREANSEAALPYDLRKALSSLEIA